MPFCRKLKYFEHSFLGTVWNKNLSTTNIGFKVKWTHDIICYLILQRRHWGKFCICNTFPETMSIMAIISHCHLESTSRKPGFSSIFRSNLHDLICWRCRDGIESSLLFTPHVSIALSSKSKFKYIVLFSEKFLCGVHANDAWAPRR